MPNLISLTVRKDVTVVSPAKTIARPADKIKINESSLIVAGNTTNLSAVISGIESTGKLEVGQRVTGAGIAANATVVSVDSATQITLSGASTATATGVALTFLDTIVIDMSTNIHRQYTVTQTPAALVAAS